MSKKQIFYLEAIILLGISTLLMTLDSRFLALRHVFIFVAGIYSAWHLIRSTATMASLGIRKDHLLHALMDIIFPSSTLILGTFLIFYFLPLNYLKMLVGYDPLPAISLGERVLAYVTLSSPIQELIFRGYVTWRISEVFIEVKTIEFLSVGIFAFVHLPFRSPLLILITIIMGIIYIKNYQKYQNLFAPIISHSIVGASIILIRNIWFPYV